MQSSVVLLVKKQVFLQFLPVLEIKLVLVPNDLT